MGLTPLKERFIPAGAGNSKQQAQENLLKTVYPRWRGELKNIGILLVY
ncbi:hypothetical protein ECXG_00931 [Escherichia coli TA447]|uniref:Uncharacterized protein n=1 Tax=Escherichia coli TA447 TaxID=656447 RepID=A0A1X3IW40_ECOLX|nr:hypothetical protein AB26_3227 [Escherichia coli 2-011-08_S1_C2]OSK92421.1 hypothetical protein ECXG_00931 [Escherichia coli TA447]